VFCEFVRDLHVNLLPTPSMLAWTNPHGLYASPRRRKSSAWGIRTLIHASDGGGALAWPHRSMSIVIREGSHFKVSAPFCTTQKQARRADGHSLSIPAKRRTLASPSATYSSLRCIPPFHGRLCADDRHKTRFKQSSAALHSPFARFKAFSGL